MKRRIRSIFWLMALCILGINGFQAYWLYNTYQLTTEQFQRAAREALLSVVQQYQVGTARRLVRPGTPGNVFIFQQFSGTNGNPERIVVRKRLAGPADTTAVASLRLVPSNKLERRTGQPNSPADTLARRISDLLLNDWRHDSRPDLPKLYRAYRSELTLRDMPTAFRLDTLRLPLGKYSRLGQPDTVVAATPAADAYFQTPPVPLNPLSRLYVQAAFPAPTFYVLRRMGGLLGGAVLLLALTTGCFVLMLSTILRQKKLSEVKNDFINNMTHELKTPLATVSAAVEALQHFGALHDPQKTQTYLSISRHELQRLSDLVEKVLNIAVEERQTLTLNPELVRPAELVREVVARHELQAPKPVQFELDLPENDAVRLDRLHIAGILNNLIDNAIKYSREQVTIAIRSRRDEHGWRLTIADDGLGIPKSYQDAIFDRFFRVPTGNLHPVKGFGLGLYYVRQVVERHGGHIAVRSELGRGSEFALWLPGNLG